MDWYTIAVAVGIAVTVSFFITLWLVSGAIAEINKKVNERFDTLHSRVTLANERSDQAHRRITTIRDGVASEIKALKEWRTINDTKTAALEKYLGIKFNDKEYTVGRKEAHYEKVGKKK